MSNKVKVKECCIPLYILYISRDNSLDICIYLKRYIHIEICVDIFMHILMLMVIVGLINYVCVTYVCHI